jgi:hypothetical protein
MAGWIDWYCAIISAAIARIQLVAEQMLPVTPIAELKYVHVMSCDTQAAPGKPHSIVD